MEVVLECAKRKKEADIELFQTFSSLEFSISPLQLCNNIVELMCISSSVLMNFVLVSGNK